MTDNKHTQCSQELSGDGLGDDASETTGVGAQQDDRATATNSGTSGESAVQIELVKARAEAAELNERLLRVHADFDNYRRRVSREKEELAIYANQKLLVNLLPVLDNLERALATPGVEGDEKLRQGVELTARSFRELLAREGLTPVEAVGQPFDPNRHEAVMTVESDAHEDGAVVLEFQKGYRLGDRVIRPSMVQVSKKG